jgi:NTP pyrophosphatase (non-canonical NTP hydrolase)
MDRNRKEAWDSFQDEVGQWADKTFMKSSPQTVVTHLKREVAELEETGEPDEVADCVLLLLHYAHKRGISIFEECVKKHEVNKRRKWGKPDAEGIQEHEK